MHLTSRALRTLALGLALSLLLSGCSVDLERVRSFFPFLSQSSEETDAESAEESAETTDAESAEESAETTDAQTDSAQASEGADASAASEESEASGETTDMEEPAEAEASPVVSDTIQAQQAAVLTISMESGDLLNPFTSDSLANITFFSLMYEGLFTVTPEFTAEPVLCRDYTVSSDELTYAFGIQQGVTFTDGTTLTADDVVYSLETARDSEMYGARFAYIDSITASSDYQVVITLSTPMENLPLLLDIPIVKSGTGSASIPTGTGPYQLALTDSGGILSPYAGWWQDTEQPFRRIELVSFTDGLTQRNMFETGQLDLVLTDPNAVGAATYHSDYELWSQDTTIMQYLGFNMDSAMFSTSAVRSAITWLIDRQTIVSEYAGSMALVAELPVSPSSSLYDSKLAEDYSYDLEKFREAIAETDLDDTDGDGILELYGEKMEGTLLVCSDSSQRVNTAQYIADLLNAEGFHITVDTRSAEEFEEALNNREYTLYYAEARLTADFDLTPFFSASGSLNYGGMTNEEAQQLCTLSLENSGNFYNLYTKIMDEGLFCPVLFKIRAVYTTRGAVSGLKPSPTSVFYDLGSVSCYGN